ncbi:hypothetical protein BH10ACI1_BH10ACI1_09780 [soil metagenome]
MSLKRKIISAIISTFAVVTFTTFVSAQDSNTNTQQQDSTNQQRRERRERNGFGKRNGFGRERGGGGMMRGLGRLNLTDAQKQQIRVIMEANRPDPNSFEEVRGLMDAKRNGTLTAEQEQKLEAFRAEHKQKREQVETQILGILTVEQRAELDKMKAKMKQRREERQKMRQNRQDSQTEQRDN